MMVTVIVMLIMLIIIAMLMLLIIKVVRIMVIVPPMRLTMAQVAPIFGLIVKLLIAMVRIGSQHCRRLCLLRGSYKNQKRAESGQSDFPQEHVALRTSSNSH
jgi:hypothetical protein